jgi:nucleoside-diphosphate-sugar epimerase
VAFEEVVDVAPERRGQTTSLLDSTKILRDLNWKPHVDLIQGIDSVILWAKEHLNFLKTQSFTYTLTI